MNIAYTWSPRCGYEVTGNGIRVFDKLRYRAVQRFRRALWESREYAAGRYTINQMTGDIVYSRDEKGDR